MARFARESATIVPSLYGIVHSNRNFSDPYYWGKNQFTSSFPVALCCYMRDNGTNAVYISADGQDTSLSEISFSAVFGTKLSNEALKFSFEDVYEPYGEFLHDANEKIDLVIRNAATNAPIRPLEIKLTTLPDDGTSGLDDEEYGSELVVRSPTMRYLALGMASAVSRQERSMIRDILEPVCKDIGTDWSSARAMLVCRKEIFDALEIVLFKIQHLQKPLLVQPIWKTVGKSPVLADNCMDVFVWSDFALARMLLKICADTSNKKGITRPQRSLLRLCRFLYEFSSAGKVFQKPIYSGMTYGKQSDKEFAVNGAKTNLYMRCDRLLHPIVKKTEIKKIILGGGQRLLSPERRLDAILFFSKDLFDE